MKSIKQIEQDKRVSSVERNPDYDPDYSDTNSKYLLWLKDGWVFNDGSHIAGANSVQELNALLAEIEQEKGWHTMNDAKRKANKKYKAANVSRVMVEFYPTDADLLEHINKQPKKQTYIKDLIRRDMKGE